MKRRTFIAGLGSAAAWPVVARAQQAAMPVVGYLDSASADRYAPLVAAFRQGLKETRYVEGQILLRLLAFRMRLVVVAASKRQVRTAK